jgi:hypothetical protein
MIFRAYSKTVPQDYSDGLYGLGNNIKNLLAADLVKDYPEIGPVWNSSWKRGYNHPEPEFLIGEFKTIYLNHRSDVRCGRGLGRVRKAPKTD